MTNKAIRILLLTDGLVLLAEGMLGPIYALFVEKVGGDLLAASTTFAVFSLVAGVLTFLFSWLSDKAKETELLLVLGYVVTGLAFGGYILVQSPLQLFMIQAVLGVGAALVRPSFDALMTRHADMNHATSQWGMWEGMNNITAGLGALGGGIIAVHFGFIPLFIAMASLCFVSAIFILRLPRNLL